MRYSQGSPAQVVHHAAQWLCEVSRGCSRINARVQLRGESKSTSELFDCAVQSLYNVVELPPTCDSKAAIAFERACNNCSLWCVNFAGPDTLSKSNTEYSNDYLQLILSVSIFIRGQAFRPTIEQKKTRDSMMLYAPWTQLHMSVTTQPLKHFTPTSISCGSLASSFCTLLQACSPMLLNSNCESHRCRPFECLCQSC